MPNMSTPEMAKGMSIFLDVFRRADKNDDNCISKDEFHSYFADGVLKPEELDELFNTIDTHNSNNIDTGELCTYFSNHLGPYQQIFGALEDLTQGVSKALQQTAEEYPKKSFYDQFTVRFLLKEVTTQLAAVERSVDTASAHLDEEALKGRESQSIPAEVTGPSTTSNAGWIRRRARRQLSTQTSIPMAGLTSLNEQVDRLRSLIDELGSKVKIDPVDEEQVSLEDDSLVAVVSRKMSVKEEHTTTFKDHLRTYLETACNEPGCISISVRSVKDANLYTIFEVWETPTKAERHLESENLLTFKKNSGSMLTGDEIRNSFNLPSKWVSGCES